MQQKEKTCEIKKISERKKETANKERNKETYEIVSTKTTKITANKETNQQRKKYKKRKRNKKTTTKDGQYTPTNEI